MDPTIDMIQRIRLLIGYMTLEEIHDRFIGEGTSEEDFYLCYKAAEVLVDDEL